MKKTLALALITLFMSSLTVMTSCKNSSSKSEQSQAESEQVTSLEGAIEENVYPLPTSVDVVKMLSELGVGYIKDISSPAENVKNYSRRAAQATNLGVYGADLSYATLYNVQPDVMKYLGSLKLLANELNISKVYDEDMYEKIKINLENKDTLVSLLTDAFSNNYTYLADNNQEALALLFVGGAWVEGMYLTTHVSEAAYHIAGISGVLLEQKKSFELYLELTKAYASDPDLGEFVKSLDPIKQVYAGLGTSLSQQNIADITKAIEGIRNKLVK